MKLSAFSLALLNRDLHQFEMRAAVLRRILSRGATIKASWLVRLAHLCLLIAVSMGAAVSVMAQPVTFQSLDVPGSSFTEAWDNNVLGAIVGVYFTRKDLTRRISHGFLYYQTNYFYPIDCNLPKSAGTSLRGINSAGDVVGFYQDSVGATHAFLLHQGVCTNIDPQIPGVKLFFPVISHPSREAPETTANRISNTGEIVGAYITHDSHSATTVRHGFRRDVVGNYTTLDVQIPNVTVVDTNAKGVNSMGEVVGKFDSVDPITGQTATHGFLWTPTAGFMQLDFPNSTSTVTSTKAVGINETGDVIGNYEDAVGIHGFIWLRKTKKFTSFDLPNSTDTEPNAIESRVVGFYIDSSDVTHGFVLP